MCSETSLWSWFAFSASDAVEHLYICVFTFCVQGSIYMEFIRMASGDGPANPTMSAYQCKVQESTGY